MVLIFVLDMATLARVVATAISFW